MRGLLENKMEQNSKKVLIFSVEYPPFGGGAGIVAFDMSNKFLRYGCKVDILTNQAASVQKACGFLNVRQLPMLFPLQYGKILRKIIKEYDCIILNDLGAALTACLFLNDNEISQTVVLLHGSEPEKIFENPSPKFRIIFFSQKYKNLLLKCKKVVCVSKYMRDKIRNEVKELELERCLVVHNGADQDIYHPESWDIRQTYKIGPEVQIIFTASRIVKQKGYPEMYAIFRKLRKEKKLFIWIIAGEGAYRGELQQKAQEDGLDKFIYFTGKLTADELRRYYSNADVFLLLSKYREAYGLVYLEALMCGTPVIGMKLGGTAEIIKHEKNGFLVTNENECLDLLMNQNYKMITSQMIRQSIPSYEEEFKNFLDEVL